MLCVVSCPLAQAGSRAEDSNMGPDISVVVVKPRSRVLHIRDMRVCIHYIDKWPDRTKHSYSWLMYMSGGNKPFRRFHSDGEGPY